MSCVEGQMCNVCPLFGLLMLTWSCQQNRMRGHQSLQKPRIDLHLLFWWSSVRSRLVIFWKSSFSSPYWTRTLCLHLPSRRAKFLFLNWVFIFCSFSSQTWLRQEKSSLATYSRELCAGSPDLRGTRSPRKMIAITAKVLVILRQNLWCLCHQVSPV